MKEALLKKRYGFPAAAALLLVLLLSGTALAWYGFATLTANITVNEALSIGSESSFSDNMYPGETTTWSFDIANPASAGYEIKADVTYSTPSISVTNFDVVGDKGTSADITEDIRGGDNSAVFGIAAHETLSCFVDITAAGDAAPGEELVGLTLSRQ